MAASIRELLFGTTPRRRLFHTIQPVRSFEDVVLPESTHQALKSALTQIEKHELIFDKWGLGERHSNGLGLAFHFCGPPGTGKTICAEALAHSLGKRLFVVRYSEIESMWVGQTGKNITSVFRGALSENAVLFFDEADAIASRRFASVTAGYEREANLAVNVLLNELESFTGVVIFATNLAANFDPAFERRIRTHVVFELPKEEHRVSIWKVQLHSTKTPLAEDVDFNQLAARFEVSGGDIKNAVLKAAQIASLEPGEDSQKKIHQHHFIRGMEEVLASKEAMNQSLFGNQQVSLMASLAEAQGRVRDELEEVEKAVQEIRDSTHEQTAHLQKELRQKLRYVWLALFAIALLAAAFVLAWLL